MVGGTLSFCPQGAFVLGLGRDRTSVARKVGCSTKFKLSYKTISAASPPDWRRTIQQLTSLSLKPTPIAIVSNNGFMAQYNGFAPKSDSGMPLQDFRCEGAIVATFC